MAFTSKHFKYRNLQGLSAFKRTARLTAGPTAGSTANSEQNCNTNLTQTQRTENSDLIELSKKAAHCVELTWQNRKTIEATALCVFALNCWGHLRCESAMSTTEFLGHSAFKDNASFFDG